MENKICMSTEYFYILLVILSLMTLYYYFNNKDNKGTIDNFSLAMISKKLKMLEDTPLFASRYPPKDKTIILKNKEGSVQKLTKQEALEILTNESTRIKSNKLTPLQNQVFNQYPELVANTQPKSLVINKPNESLVEPNHIIILDNDVDTILEDPVKSQIDYPIRIASPFESPLAVPDLEKRMALETRDKDAVFNDFRAPERRDPEYAYPTNDVKNIINVPTRGLPDNYHSVGVVVRKTDEKIFQLFGREKYPGSSQWEYYVAGADNYGYPNKMPLTVKGNRELSDKERVELPWLDKKNGDFEVNLYNFDVPRYNPYDI